MVACGYDEAKRKENWANEDQGVKNDGVRNLTVDALHHT